MEFKSLIETRRSVRKYKKGEALSNEQLMELFTDARMAPSWKNTETARSYVAVSEEKIAEVRACMAAVNQPKTMDVAALIVTTFVKDTAGFTNGVADNEMGNLVGAYDLGLYNSYLVLKASDMGLDTLIMGIRDGEALRKVMDIPENEQVMMVLCLGYRDGDVKLNPRKPIEDMVKFC